MKSPTLLRRLTTHACVVLLLSNFAPAGLAQRRRRAPAAPRTQTQAPARTPRVSPAPEAAPPRTQSQQARRAEPELSVEEMLAADSYTVYMELRRVGTLARVEEIKSAVASLGLVGGPEAKPVTDLYAFVSDNAEALGESRVVVAFMPARTEVPQALMAVELESAEAAAAFEPKLRRMLGEKVPQVRRVIDGAAPGPVVVPKEEAKERARAARPSAPFALRRAGRWLLAADSPFTLKRLRGEPDGPALADITRFQNIRSRFASDSLFVYVDTNVAQQGWALQMQRASEARPPHDAPTDVTAIAPNTNEPAVIVETTPPGTAPVNPEAQPEAAGQTAEPTLVNPEAPAREMSDEERAIFAAAERAAQADEATEASKAEPPPPPTEEELALGGMERVVRGLWGGVPRIPGAVALGLSLDRGALAVRLAVENTPDGTVSIIPFLPNLVSGPPVTGETAAVAPADAELFVAGSLDWTQVWNSTLGAAAVNPMSVLTAAGAEERGEGSAERQPTVDETIAAVEKLFGFKFKEDLLPALGNEVAFSMPLNSGDFGLGPYRAPGEKKEEREVEPGFLYIASLNNPERLREILPRVLVALGFSSPGTPRRAEKRKGFDIHTLGEGSGLSYAFVNNYLVAGELKAVRHCVDSYDARQTLASANAYRDAVGWQAKQKLVHLYLSDAAFKNAYEETRKRSGGSTDPVVQLLLAQLAAAETAPASYEATNDGEVVLHEARFPISLVRTYALSAAVAVKDSPVIMNETMAVYALNRIAGAQSAYKDDRKKGRYGTLEELVAEELLEKTFLENLEYKIELDVTADKFEVSATPKNYGKSGRRSFFVDNTGTVRGADHKGEPANSDDPVEQ